MDVGIRIIRSLEEALAGLQDLHGQGRVRGALHVEGITAEALAGIPATQLPCGLLAVGLPRRRGSWQTGTGTRVLWTMAVSVGVAVLLPVRGGQLETLAAWGRRLESLLEQDAPWTRLAVEIHRTAPPGSLCQGGAGLAGCVHQPLDISYVTQ